MITPHGGRLITLELTEEENAELLATACELPLLTLNEREKSDLELIGNGAMSPLTGFMTGKDYNSVIDSMRLASGIIWSLPVTLSVKEGDLEVETGQRALLRDGNGVIWGDILVEDIFDADLSAEADKVLLTTDESHPGVEYLNGLSGTYIGGSIRSIRRRDQETFRNYRLDPKETRDIFQARNWSTIVAFQTRNPIHRAHEYIQKTALELIDGLLIHPLVGSTKSDDIPADIRMHCYEVLLDGYYPESRVMMSVFPAAMRYAGPREAIFHAILRKNYGCTHLIVGRDHAGVGAFYGTYDAQLIFDRFDPDELEIVPLKFEHAFFCNKCGGMATAKTCPHESTDHVFLSGKKVRAMLREGILPPEEFTRPEIAQLLMDAWGNPGD
jgi:sulfate adenylyltransferase